MSFEDMKLPQLKAEAKSRKIKGFSTMRKDDLIRAILDFDDNETDNEAFEAEVIEEARKESFIDGIKAAFTNMRQDRKLKGVKASQFSTVAKIKESTAKAQAFRLQRGSATAKMTPKQARRVRKTERRLAAYSA